MHLGMLERLRCPFCGTRLVLVESSPMVRNGDDLVGGVLGCECCAYPVVDGIPVLIADDRTRRAMHEFEAGRADDARATLLGLDGEAREAFEALLNRPDGLTYRAALQILSPDAEGTYFLYRLSDPTHVMSQSILDSLAEHAIADGPAIDICGGSGHLARALAGGRPGREVVVADVFFWKLWLAKAITAPLCTPVCCDANSPLPFIREAFRLVVLSDAFPYIWHKRLLADEMMRLMRPSGAIFMPHLHSSLGENFSAGMTLTPQSYRDLFDGARPRLFSDSGLIDGILRRGEVDLGRSVSADALGAEPSFTLIASHDPSIFERRTIPVLRAPQGELRVNPLYDVSVAGGESTLTLAFPNTDYEEEFGGCRQYMPDSLVMPGDATRPLSLNSLGERGAMLRQSRVILDVPLRYL